MKILLKLFTAPLILALTLLVAVMMFLFEICSMLLTIASIIMALLGFGLFLISSPTGGVIYLIIAFLLSPYGLQAIASSVIGAADSLNSSLRRFLVS